MYDFELSDIQSSSHRVDALWNQFNGSDYMHGMRAPGQSAASAHGEADAFIQEHLARARADQATYVKDVGGNFSEAALFEFGEAAHTITDRLSPAHRGEQVWNVWQWGFFGMFGKHKAREATISGQEMAEAVYELRVAFAGVFGKELTAIASTTLAQCERGDTVACQDVKTNERAYASVRAH